MKFWANLLSVVFCFVNAFTVGCSDETKPMHEPAVIAAGLLGFGVDLLTRGDTHSFGNAPGRFAAIAADCATEIKIDLLGECGNSVLGSARFEWNECTLTLPEDAPISEVTVSGTLDITNQPAGDCTAGDAMIDRTAAFKLSRKLKDSLVMDIRGSASAHRVQTDSDTFDIEVNISREVRREETLEAFVNVEGVIFVVISRESDTRTISGDLTMSLKHPRLGQYASTLKLQDLVLVPDDVCRLPIGGSVLRNTEGENRLLEFQSACGEVTLNGEPKELSDLSCGARYSGRGRK